jgi:hypothetical protein
MNTNLLKALNQITAQYGEEVLGDPARLKALFSDLAKDEPKPLRLAFGRCIETGAYTALKHEPDAAERAVRKAALAQRVRDEHGLDSAFCAEALDILEAAIFGTASAAQQPPPAPPPVTETAPRKPANGAVQVVSSSGGVGYGIALIDPPPAPPLVYADPAAASIQPNPPRGEQQSPGRKVRHGFTTFWLILEFIIFGGFFMVFLYSAATEGISVQGDREVMGILVFILAGLISVCLFLLLHWKKVGFQIMFYAGLAGLIALYLVDKTASYRVGCIEGILIVLTYGVLRLRGSNGKSAWEQLE